jgi:hypothetical protein
LESIPGIKLTILLTAIITLIIAAAFSSHSRSLTSRILNTLFITPKLLKVPLDILRTNSLPTFRKRLKEILHLIAKMVVNHRAFNGTHAVDVAEGCFPALEKTACSRAAGGVMAFAVVGEGRFVGFFFFAELGEGCEVRETFCAAAEAVVEVFEEEEGEGCFWGWIGEGGVLGL